VEFYDVPESALKGGLESIGKRSGEPPFNVQDQFINPGRVVSATRTIRIQNAAGQFFVFLLAPLQDLLSRIVCVLQTHNPPAAAAEPGTLTSRFFLKYFIFIFEIGTLNPIF
jgi:hypothetical protein